MEERTLHILEFDKVISLLCTYASSEAGREMCAKIRPSANIKKIREYQKNTSDARRRIEKQGKALSFRGVKDISDILSRLRMEAALSAPELLKVSSLLNVCERAKSFDSENEGEDSLSEDFSFIVPLTGVNREIKRCILSEEEIADDASAGLSSVRRRMKATEERIREEITVQLNRCRDYLSEAVVTQRDGRMCLPVKAEYKSKVPGLLHDISSTGLTLFIEPVVIVNLNNDLKELETLEKQEIARVLEELSASLSPYTDDLKENVRILKRLDMIFAKALFANDLWASEPEFTKEKYIELINARHPLLDRKKVVPVNIRLGREFSMLVITGPNTGGKTVSLKTLGLLQLMGQSGLHIPCDEGSKMCVFNEVYADIGDEQSIEQSLSTFSAHMTNIVRILDTADKDSLCLFDELGSGTDPTEGAALAMAVLSFLHRMDTFTAATTHYAEIKVFALKTPGIENACCEFDVASLKPTYRLLIGVPGKSNAFAISKRLGLPDHIIEEAKGFIGEADENFEDVIEKLNEDRRIAEHERLQAEAYRRETEEIRGRLKKKEDRIEELKEKVLEDARNKARKILEDAKITADETVKALNKMSVSDGREMESQRDRLREGIKKYGEKDGLKIKGPAKQVSPAKLKIGDTCRVMSLGGTECTVTSLPDRDGNVQVQMGFLSSKVNVKDLELTDAGGKEKKDRGTGSVSISFEPKALSISPELNLIGKNSDEALMELEKYLDDACLSHLSTVRIVHGRGTGVLRDACRKKLKSLRFVKEFHDASIYEGGDGATVVTFK